MLRRLLRPACIATLFAAAACSAPADPLVDSDESELRERRTVHIDEGLPALTARDFEKAFETTFAMNGVSVNARLATKTHFELTRASLSGDLVVVGRRAPRIESAALEAQGAYAASVEVDLDLVAEGSGAAASRELSDANSEWKRQPLSGIALPIATKLVPLDIPVAPPLFVHTHVEIALACAVADADGQSHVHTKFSADGEIGADIAYRHVEDVRDEFEFDRAKRSSARREPTQATTTGRLTLRCGVQPALVVLLQRTIGMRLVVEPYVDVTLQNGASTVVDRRGVMGYAETDIRVFGRRLPMPIQFPLFDAPIE